MANICSVHLSVIARLKPGDDEKNLQVISHVERNFHAKSLNEEVF